MQNLKIYTASAGSGKTYQLAYNYIRELFQDPIAYKKTLAVTFTNKAAAEMKSRILQKLHQLANQHPSSDDYAEKLIREKLAAGPDEVQAISFELLNKILHDYSSLYVQTIDKFFQWVLRGFTRELGLSVRYNLELDQNGILAEAVDRLYASLDDDEQLKKWLIRFAEEQLSGGKSWDFQREILRLGKEVFQESYQLIREETENPGFRDEKYNSLSKKVYSTIANYEKSLTERAEKVIGLLEKNGLTLDDFKGRSRSVPSFFYKIPDADFAKLEMTKTFLKGLDNSEEWINTKSPNRSTVESLYEESLAAIHKEVVDIMTHERIQYNTAILIRQNFYSFGILNDIYQKIREIARDKNIFLISDTAPVLKSIIQSNEAPFIYEKAGNFFSRFMLDEFQDTSRFQWENFLPLIRNAMATGENSVIVGDVKQAIYRWRNSDWNILATELYDAVKPERMQLNSLSVNYRSSENVIKFNNSLFSVAPDIINSLVDEMLPDGNDDMLSYYQALIRHIYGKAGQQIPDKTPENKGYITHQFVNLTDKAESLDYSKNWIISKIQELQDRGFRAGDIVFLVRTRQEGKDIAAILAEAAGSSDARYNFNVISNESLFLLNNPSVKFLRALLQFFNRSDDRLNLSYIKYEYAVFLASGENVITDPHKIFSGLGLEDNPFPDDSSFSQFTKQIDPLRRLPLPTLVEKLIEMFGLSKDSSQIAYIQAFQDEVLEFIRNETSDISAFLDYLDKNGEGLSLNISQEQDAIAIMTIFKAKGLEFKTVLIPFCNWSIKPGSSGNKTTTLWPSTRDSLFNDFSSLPVVYKETMADSVFREDYYEERFRTLVDNLNLIYVAFTRAEFELHMLSHTNTENNTCNNVGDVIFSAYTKASESNDDIPRFSLDKYFDAGTGLFSFGDPELKPGAGEQVEGIQTLPLNTYPSGRQSSPLVFNHKNIYLSGLKEDGNKTGYGTQMHEIFAGIVVRADVDGAVKDAWQKGLLLTGERDRLCREIHDRLKIVPPLWFQGVAEVKNETDIGAKGEILRPDRIMIFENELVVLDYKFGNEKQSHYHNQIQEYGDALKVMGYENIRLFLWYYNLNEVEEVKYG